MSIFVDSATRLCVQGITGRDGSFHAKGMREYGTRVVAGVTPGKGGGEADGVPVYDSVAEAVAFVASDRARHITGEILNVAAGAYMRN